MRSATFARLMACGINSTQTVNSPRQLVDWISFQNYEHLVRISEMFLLDLFLTCVTGISFPFCPPPLPVSWLSRRKVRRVQIIH